MIPLPLLEGVMDASGAAPRIEALLPVRGAAPGSSASAPCCLA